MRKRIGQASRLQQFFDASRKSLRRAVELAVIRVDLRKLGIEADHVREHSSDGLAVNRPEARRERVRRRVRRPEHGVLDRMSCERRAQKQLAPCVQVGGIGEDLVEVRFDSSERVACVKRRERLRADVT